MNSEARKIGTEEELKPGARECLFDRGSDSGNRGDILAVDERVEPTPEQRACRTLQALRQPLFVGATAGQ